MEYLLAIGLAMFAGLFLSRLASKFNLPDVTSYLVAGVLIGPLCLGALADGGALSSLLFNAGAALLLTGFLLQRLSNLPANP